MSRKTPALRAQTTTPAQCLYQTLFCFFYSLFLLFMAEQLYGYGIPLASKLTYGLLFSFVFCLMHSYPKLDALLRICIIGGLLYSFCSILSEGRLFDLLYTLNALAFWFVRVFPAEMTFNEPLFQLCLCLLVTLAVSLALRWKLSPPLFFLMGMVLIVFAYFVQISVSFWLYALFFTLSFTHLTVFIHQKTAAKSGGRQVSPLRYALAALPLCAVALAFASLIPTPARPPGQVVADSIGAGSFLGDIFAKDYGANLSYANLTGGLSDGRLGGGRPNQSNAVLFTVETDKPTYLSYKHFDTYQSTRWTSTREDKQELPAYDSLWKGRPLQENEWIRQQLSIVSRLPRLRTQTIVLQGLRTQSLFVANQTLAVNVNDDLSIMETEGGDVYASVSQGRGFTYTLTNHDEFPSGDDLDTFLRLYAKQMREVPPKLSASIVIPDTPPEYTALPDTVPERVGELAQTITQGQTNTVDIANALIDYLHENYTYALDVPRTPSDRDFVDYFLFETDKGYCTYFASALAVMLRTLDIPCRYVEGFMPPSKPVSGNVYNVIGRYAHAWVEVYFPGIGWFPFEPTPPAGLAPDSPPTFSPSSPTPSLFPTPTPSALPGTSVMPSSFPSSEPDPDETKAGFPWWLPLTLAGLGLAVIAARKVRRYQKERFTRNPTPAKMAQLYRLILRRCRRARLVPQRMETPIEFGLRADALLQTETPLVSQAAALYAKTLFSGEPPTLDDMRALADIASSFSFTKKRKKQRENESTLDV